MDNNNKNYIPISATIGGIGGAIYGWRHPSEKSCVKIAQTSPSFADTMQGYKSCFDLEKAKEALNEKKITQDEFTRIENLLNSINNVYEKEKKVAEIANTPYEERTQSFKSAVREAYGARPRLYKNMMKFTKELQDKFSDLKIYDKEKFTETYIAAGKKLKVIFKELSKNASIGLAAGIAGGTLFGYFLNRISNK